MRPYPVAVPQGAAPASDGPHAIRARQLTKTYTAPRKLTRLLTRLPAFTAIDQIDLAVAPGQVFGLLGLNGAGKTTLVRMLCGLLLPTSGAAHVLGYDVQRESARIRRSVGLASGEERSFSWRLSARRNLLFFAELHGMRGAPARARVEQLIAMLGLAIAGERPVGSFSSGMRQKLALARALLHTPPLLFLDEPTRGLDLRASDELLTWIGEDLVARHGTTVFLTTHQMQEAQRLCTTVAILHSGRIRATGSPSQLYDGLGLAHRYTIRLAGPPPALPEALRQRLPDLVVTGDAAASLLTFREQCGALNALLEYLTAARHVICEISVAPPALEDVFRHYTETPGLGDAVFGPQQEARR
jgi:ABC-2 type transport system ATP-binding protein